LKKIKKKFFQIFFSENKNFFRLFSLCTYVNESWWYKQHVVWQTLERVKNRFWLFFPRFMWSGNSVWFNGSTELKSLRRRVSVKFPVMLNIVSCWRQCINFCFISVKYLLHMTNFLTLWEPAYNILIPRFRPKNSSFRLPYQRPSSSTDCARELFKGSNGSASLLVCTRKKFFGWGLRIFFDWCHKWSSFRVILANVTWPRAQPLGQSGSLKFSLETRLESESFEPLINFLAFLVQKLGSKINKVIKYLISQIFLLLYIITFEPETPAGHPKYEKTWIIA